MSKAILDYYSLPKNPGLNGNIYDSTLPETADYNSFTGRLDQKISNNNKMFVRYSWYNRDSIYNEYLDSAASGTWFQFQSYQAVIDDVHVFNPTTVLNVRYGYNRFERNSGQQEEARNFDLTTLGFPAEYNTLVPEVNRYFPRLDFDGTTMIDVAYGNDFRPTTSHTVVATLNKVLAAHSLKGGDGDADLPRGQPLHRQRPGRAVRLHERLHPADAAPPARTTRACRTTPPSSSGCPPRRRSSGPRTTPSTPRRGASSCRTTGG